MRLLLEVGSVEFRQRPVDRWQLVQDLSGFGNSAESAGMDLYILLNKYINQLINYTPNLSNHSYMFLTGYRPSKTILNYTIATLPLP